ncbi:MAG: recombinase family protein, partial [Oscillospiraceae bacterium]
MGVRVTELPVTVNRFTENPVGCPKRRRTAAYARVSSNHDDQLTSYAAQVSYYTSVIQNHDNLDFVRIYADEGITGTSTVHRNGFKQMISDALAGEIDLIITKSVSRFARNTVDSLSTIRLLKAHGVECYFEKENIRT